jgi:hypothetical protein
MSTYYEIYERAFNRLLWLLPLVFVSGIFIGLCIARIV